MFRLVSDSCRATGNIVVNPRSPLYMLSAHARVCPRQICNLAGQLVPRIIQYVCWDVDREFVGQLVVCHLNGPRLNVHHPVDVVYCPDLVIHNLHYIRCT